MITDWKVGKPNPPHTGEIEQALVCWDQNPRPEIIYLVSVTDLPGASLQCAAGKVGTRQRLGIVIYWHFGVGSGGSANGCCIILFTESRFLKKASWFSISFWHSLSRLLVSPLRQGPGQVRCCSTKLGLASDIMELGVGFLWSARHHLMLSRLLFIGLISMINRESYLTPVAVIMLQNVRACTLHTPCQSSVCWCLIKSWDSHDVVRCAGRRYDNDTHTFTSESPKTYCDINVV